MTSSENSKWRKMGHFFHPFNEPKQLPKSKCAYIEGHARTLPAPGVFSEDFLYGVLLRDLFVIIEIIKISIIIRIHSKNVY